MSVCYVGLFFDSVFHIVVIKKYVAPYIIDTSLTSLFISKVHLSTLGDKFQF